MDLRCAHSSGRVCMGPFGRFEQGKTDSAPVFPQPFNGRTPDLISCSLVNWHMTLHSCSSRANRSGAEHPLFPVSSRLPSLHVFNVLSGGFWVGTGTV